MSLRETLQNKKRSDRARLFRTAHHHTEKTLVGIARYFHRVGACALKIKNEILCQFACNLLGLHTHFHNIIHLNPILVEKQLAF